MFTPFDAVARANPPVLPATPANGPSGNDPFAEGKTAADRLLELVPTDIRHGEPGELEFLVAEFSGDVQASLERAAEDPAYAAGLVEQLGPDGFSRLTATVDRTPLLDRLGDDANGQTATELLSLLGQTLGAATRMPGSPVDAAFVARIAEQDGFVTDGSLDPELAAILLNEGDYTPDTAAQLGGHVFLEADPPRVYDQPDGYIDTSAHRAPLLTPKAHNVEFDNIGAWATATHGILRNQAAAEVVALRDGEGNPVVADRLLDPSLTDGQGAIMNPLTTAILDTPRHNLATNPTDDAALSAVEALVQATDTRNGDVGEWAREPLAQLYMTYPGEILNTGEGRDAFPAATQSPLGERLARLPVDHAGAGADMITAALGAGGTPPLRRDQVPSDPLMPGTDRYDSWQEAIYAATDGYRGEVQAHGPPDATDVQGTAYVNVEDLAGEIADIDAELIQGQFGADAIRAADLDADNTARQDAFNVATDYLALGLGFGAGGATRSVFANAYNAHAESPLLDKLWPTDNASRVFQASVPEFAQALVAAQTIQIVEASARSGALALPESLLDPATGGLRAPSSAADGEQFAADVVAFIDDPANEALAKAIDGAAADLMSRVNALETGAYRGGG